jgi:LacI family transcriptional regulator
MLTPKKPTSLRDIAMALGMSPATVSRALANMSSISEATRLRVQQYAQELQYFPNHLAASLRKGRSQTLGLIVPHLNGYFFPAVMTGIVQVASQAGYSVLMCQSDEDVCCERRNIRTLMAAQVEGIILSVAATTRADIGHLEAVQQQGTPLVFFERVPELPQSTAVVLDDFLGAYQAVTHLIEQGYRRIAHFAGPQHLSTNHNRYLGYQQALRVHSLPTLPEWVYPLTSSSLEEGRAGMHQLLQLDSVPDAVFAAYAYPAVGALEVLQAQGLRVPHDVALVCFGEPFTNISQLNLTSVDQRAEQMGEAAMHLLLQLLKGDLDYQPPHVVLKPELHVRASSLRVKAITLDTKTLLKHNSIIKR